VIVITATGPYFEPFDIADNWLIGQSEISSGQIVEGRYVLAITQPSMLAWSVEPRAFGDGVYEVDATLISGAEASGFGLVILAAGDMNAFLVATITGDGRYDLGLCERSCTVQQSLVGGYTLNQAILTDNQTNHLRIEARGGTISFSVNGAPVSQLTGLTYQPGLVGLYAESSPYGGMQAAFDNLAVAENSSQ
jgi:hypothetical protein